MCVGGTCAGREGASPPSSAIPTFCEFNSLSPADGMPLGVVQGGGERFPAKPSTHACVCPCSMPGQTQVTPESRPYDPHSDSNMKGFPLRSPAGGEGRHGSAASALQQGIRTTQHIQ
eukprot:7167827-Alexandrium_andersonii.AAC.1